MLDRGPSWIIIGSLASANVSYQALVPAIIFTFIALMTVALRLYSRTCLSRQLKVEDYLVSLAMILSMVLTSIVGGEFQIDAELINRKFRLSSLETMLKLVYVQSIAFHLGINLIKISILLQYYRLFATTSKRTAVSSLVLLAAVIIATTWSTLGVIFLCTPVPKYWKIQISGTCMDAEAHFWSSAIVGIVLDFTIWILPMPAVWKLRLPARQKMSLVVVFGLGGFVCVVSILRLVLVHDAAEKGEVTKAGTQALIWSTVEVNVALICASLLVMKPLLLKLAPKMMLETEPPSAEDDAREWRRRMTFTGQRDEEGFGVEADRRADSVRDSIGKRMDRRTSVWTESGTKSTETPEGVAGDGR